MARDILSGLLLVTFFFNEANAGNGNSSRPQSPGVVKKTATFSSDGHNIRVRVMRQESKSKQPAVIILPGIDGAAEPYGAAYRWAAQMLVARGYAVFIVHYEDGARVTDLGKLKRRIRGFFAEGLAPSEEQPVREYFERCQNVVRAGIRFVQGHRAVDPDRIAVVGLSFGGYLASSVLVETSQGVAAAILLCSGLPKPLHDHLTSFPPCLMLHGGADKIVPVSEAEALRGLLVRRGIKHKFKVYPKAGHVFMNGEQFDFVILLDVCQRCLSFLAEHMPAGTVQASPAMPQRLDPPNAGPPKTRGGCPSKRSVRPRRHRRSGCIPAEPYPRPSRDLYSDLVRQGKKKRVRKSSYVTHATS